MEIKIPKSTAPRPDITKVTSNKKGTVTLLQDTRLSSDQTKESLNLIQIQDGIWRTRWGREFYGSALPNESRLDGAYEFVFNRGTIREERHIIVCGSSGMIYVSKDDCRSWIELGNTFFSGGFVPSFLQIDNRLYMTNGVDFLTIYDGIKLFQYNAITMPTNLQFTLDGLTSGEHTAFYQVTALNEIGETVASEEKKVLINKERDSWEPGTDAINLTWDEVQGALKYQIYYSDDSGYETLLDISDVNSYKDDGTAEYNPYIIAPVDDTTTAPKFKHIIMSGNRIWGTGDIENPHRVYFSGVGQFIGFFSAYFGGGWIDLEQGGKEVAMAVVNYRTGKGDESATVLTKTPEGTGSIWQISLDIATAGDLTFTLPIPAKIVSSSGCTSYRSVIYAGDIVYFPNKNGVFTLGNKEQMFNILVSAEKSQAIRPDYRALSEQNLHKMTGYYYDSKLFFSATLFGDDNNLVFIYDVERDNWTYKWDFGVRQFFEVSDSEGNGHFLCIPIAGNKLIEINDSFDTDFGEAFYTSYVSGLFTFDDRMDAFAKVYQGILEVANFKGELVFEVFGIEKNRGYRSLSSRRFVSTSGHSTIDFTNSLFGDYMFSTGVAIPEAIFSPTLKKRLRINKKLNRLQFRVSSFYPGTEYTILGVQANGRGIPLNPPNSWL